MNSILIRIVLAFVFVLNAVKDKEMEAVPVNVNELQ
jgi:hypothetical protein